MSEINLKKIIEQYPECVTSGVKLKAILLEAYPEISKAIVNTLVVMANLGIAKEIQESTNITEVDRSRWQEKLEEEGFSNSIIKKSLELFIPCVHNNTEINCVDLSDFEIEEDTLIKYSGKSPIVTIPSGIKHIEMWSFHGCNKLEKIIFPNGITDIGAYAFYGCQKLNDVIIPNGVTYIGSNAFLDCKSLNNITIPDSVVNIGKNAFDGTAWYSNQPDGVVYSGKVVYMYKGKRQANDSIFLKSGTLGISYEAFSCCENLKNITIPNSVISIGHFAFSKCENIESIFIPYGVIRIESYAFSGCTSLKSISIPESVNSIGESSFFECDNLQYMEYSNAKYLWNRQSPYFFLISLKNYDISSCNIHSETRVICDAAFEECCELKSISIPMGIINIGNSVFKNCINLSDIFLNENIVSIGDSAFDSCEALIQIKLPRLLEKIGESAFV